MRRKPDRYALIALTCLIAVAATSDIPVSQADTVSGTITYYTVKPTELVNKVVTDFQAKYPGVRVEVYRAGSGDVIARFSAEQQAGAIKADVITLADRPFVQTLERQSLLEPVRSRWLSSIDPRYVYDGGRDFETELVAIAIGYNTRLIQKPPTRLKDLLDPAYRNKIIIPDPGYSGAAFAMLATLVNTRAFGWDFYRGLKQVGTLVGQGNPAAAQAIASGERPLAAITYGDVLSLKQRGSPVDIVFPKDGLVVVPQPTGVLRTSHNLAAAEAFADFCLSPEGLADSAAFGYATVNPQIRPQGLPSFAGIPVLSADWKTASAQHAKFLSQFRAIFGLH